LTDSPRACDAQQRLVRGDERDLGAFGAREMDDARSLATFRR
jgi:hypothetical protein